MKTKLQIFLAVMLMVLMSARAQTPNNTIKAVKVEFDGNFMTIELNHHPKIVMEDGHDVIKTILNSIILPLPCRAMFVDANGTAVEDVIVCCDDEAKPLCVYSLVGKMVAALKDKPITLPRGVYIINGKKIMIK